MDRARIVSVAIAAVMTVTLACGAADPSADAAAFEHPAEVPRTSWAAQWSAQPEQGPATELEPLLAERHARGRYDVSIGSDVTSTASGSDGTKYVAGTFSGAVRLGATVVTSRGGDDVFLARIEADGGVAWARAVGSKGTESGPKVDFEDGRVKLVAMTDGSVDCGRGPLQTWDSEAFFLCTFGPDGAPIDGASFPTGRR